MREVRVRYSGAQLMRTDFKELLDICERITLMGTIWRDNEEGFLRQIFEIRMMEGQVIDSINDVHFMQIEDVLSVREEKGRVIHTAAVSYTHLRAHETPEHQTSYHRLSRLAINDAR